MIGSSNSGEVGVTPINDNVFSKVNYRNHLINKINKHLIKLKRLKQDIHNYYVLKNIIKNIKQFNISYESVVQGNSQSSLHVCVNIRLQNS